MPDTDREPERLRIQVDETGPRFEDVHYEPGDLRERVRAALPSGGAVVELALSGPDAAAFGWEAALDLSVPVVRTSPTRPRVRTQPLTTPLRLLRLDLTGQAAGRGAFDVLRGPAVLVEEVALDGLERFRAETSWPGVDILHVVGAGDRVPAITQSGDDPLSTRLAAPVGSLGWLERLCIEARVRLLTLEAQGEPQLAWLRRVAGALADRGGPAVLLDAAGQGLPGDQGEPGRPGGPGDAGLPVLDYYRRVLRDEPLDVALRDNRALTLVLGRDAADLLRPSTVADGLRDLVARLVDRRATELRSAAADRYDLEVTADPEVGLGWFAHHDLTFGPDQPGLSVLGRRLDDFRALTGVSWRHAEPGPWRGVEDEPGERYLNVGLLDADAPLLVGREYLLSVDIGPRDPLTTPIGALALVEEVFAWQPGQSGAWAEIGLTSLGLRVRGEPVQQAWIPRTGAGQRVYFTVTPDQPGVRAARICLYVNQNVVQTVKIAARCVPDERTAPVPAVEVARALGLPDDAVDDVVWSARTEYALHALDTATAPRTLSLVVNDNQGVAVTTVKAEDTFGVHTAADLPEVVERVRRTLERVAGGQHYAYGNGGDANAGSAEWFDTSVRALAEVGWELFTEVFLPDREKLRAVLADGDGRISVAHVLLDKVIPWAVAYDREFTPQPDEPAATCLAGLPRPGGAFPGGDCLAQPDCLLHDPRHTERTTACPRHFWGLRHQIELPPQQAVGGAQPRPAAGQVRAGQSPLMTVAMHGGLALLDRHLAELTDAVASSGRPPTLEPARFHRPDVVRDLNRTDQDIVYLYCHAEGGYGTNIPTPALRVRKRATDTEPNPQAEPPIRKQDVAGAPWANNPLIVLNGCRTGAFRPDALSKFIAEFVYAREAGGVLATEIAVFEELAAEIGTRFVRDFLDGRSAGQALLAIRRDLVRRRNPLGLAYTLYATTEFHLGGEGPGTRYRASIHTSVGGGSQLPEREPALVGV